MAVVESRPEIGGEKQDSRRLERSPELFHLPVRTPDALSLSFSLSSLSFSTAFSSTSCRRYTQFRVIPFVASVRLLHGTINFLNLNLGRFATTITTVDRFRFHGVRACA